MSRTALDTSWLKGNRPEHVVGFLLKSLQHTLRQTIEEALRKHGVELSFAHFAALFGLQCAPGITGAKLARSAFVSAQTMSSVLRRLEQDGRIERRPHPESRRADSWSLTPLGHADLDRARHVGAEVFTRMLAPLDASEIAAFEDYLRRCIGALETDTAAQSTESSAPPQALAEKRMPRRAAG